MRQSCGPRHEALERACMKQLSLLSTQCSVSNQMAIA
jgi:hypothetical protein